MEEKTEKCSDCNKAGELEQCSQCKEKFCGDCIGYCNYCGEPVCQGECDVGRVKEGYVCADCG